MRAKAICCLGLVCGVLGLGFANVIQNQAPIVSGPEWIDGADKLPGAAVKIPQVPVAAEPVAPTLSIFMRAATNCPAPAQAATEAKRLAGMGVKRVMLQFKQDESDESEGGALFFPTSLGPVARGFEDGRLLKFAAALDAEGIEVNAWVPLFNDAAASRMHPDWRALAYSGDKGISPREHFLCPRHPDVLAYEGAIVRAAVKAGGTHLHGVFLDFIRFDDDFSCTCDRCLATTANRLGRASIQARELPGALQSHSKLWEAWTATRGNAISAAANAMRAAIIKEAPHMWMGACVLPFSAQAYWLNTQSGQDLGELSLAALDEIMLMGYWDDWGLSPQWLAKSRAAAEKETDGEAKLTTVIDADMSIARTMTTLDALRGTPETPSFFLYGKWTNESIAALHRAKNQLAAQGGNPRPEFTAVSIRIDTEPNNERSYGAVNPGMIERLLQLFAEEKVHATFATCGRLAELQPDVIRAASAQGHEIAVHAYDHEQIDELPDDQQLAVIDRSLGVFRRMGIPVSGFAAPRNSISELARDRLIAHGLLWDGSQAFDPKEGWLNAEPVASTRDPRAGIVVMPFTIPNDWDARYSAKISGPEMAATWLKNLRAAAAAGDTTYTIDIHQWIAAQDENFEAVRQFIRGAKQIPGCRVVTVGEAAIHVLQETARADGLAWKWQESVAPRITDL
ncbi:MAG: polysaccharide deacetylase family protein [Spartobacteria bacterium]